MALRRKAARDRGARPEGEIDLAFATLTRLRVDALMVAADGHFNARRDQIVALAAREAVPAIHEWREAVGAGGLVSNGASFTGLHRQAGVCIGRIFVGAKPAELPIQRPARFELVIDPNTARALGLTIPPAILARADEVIE